jgi:hypothetical protein
MAGRDAVDLAKSPDVVEADRKPVGDAAVVHAAHAGKMQQRIKQHGSMPGRQNEAVTVGPNRIEGIIP